MLSRRPDHEPTAYDDDFADLPSSGPLPQWGGGVIVPIAMLIYGASALLTGHATLQGRAGMSADVHGPDALAVGAAAISIGVFLHCHYFWGNLYHLAAAAVLGKVVGLIGMIASLIYLLIHLGLFGR